MESPSGSLSFKGRVAVITGAGGSLGSVYAVELAARGASVVVSDIGASVSGDGSNRRVADTIVDRIRKFGGVAVADYHGMDEGEKIVETAIHEFGRIDILINNAGNLRDVSFRKMTEQDWHAVLSVHLTGAFKVTKAAWPHMEKQQYGRIIMTSSAAGLYGAFGQANYSSSKMALVGLSQTLAIEGAKNGIKVNAIAPIANSRMLSSILPADVCSKFRPECIAALVVCLCHDTCRDTGATFELGAGWFSKLQWERSQGLSVAPEKATPELVAERWNEVVAFGEGSEHPKRNTDAYVPIGKNLGMGYTPQAGKAKL